MTQDRTGARFPLLGRRMQIGIVVPDMEKALQYWTETLGVGPFVLIENAGTDRRFLHRGRVTDVAVSIAFSYMGDTQIELIHQTNTAPSPYLEFLAAGRDGIHHVAFWPDDVEKACVSLEAAGAEEVYITFADGNKDVRYYDVPHSVGVMIEIVPLTPLRQSYFAGIKALADSWDGTRPIRRFVTRRDFISSQDCRGAAAGLR